MIIFQVPGRGVEPTAELINTLYSLPIHNWNGDDEGITFEINEGDELITAFQAQTVSFNEETKTMTVTGGLYTN